MLKADECITMLIKVYNDKIASLLNGKEKIYLKDEKISAGKLFIAFQIHIGGGIEVR